MRTLSALCALSLAACPATVLTVKDASTTTLGDADVDADSDADTDVDTDTDTGIDQTGDTGDTGDSGPPPDWLVDCNGSGDFLTVQAAIDAATSDQRVGVMPCTYHEDIDFNGKAIDLYGMYGSPGTVIEGSGLGPVVRLAYGEPDGTRLAGFTITGGNDGDGAAIAIDYASVELEDLVLTGNTGDEILHAAASIVDGDGLVIQGNTIPSDGQAIQSDGGSLSLTRSTVDCDGSTDALWHHNVLILTDSTITCRPGSYAVHNYHGEDQIRRSHLEGGISGLYSYDVESTNEEPDTPDERLDLWNSVVIGGLVAVDVRYMDIDIVNCVLSGGDAALSVTDLLWGSRAAGTAFVGSDCGVTGTGPIEIDDSAFWDNDNDGCGIAVNPSVDTDPLFVAWPTDLHLQPGSPLINAGPQGGDYTDADGTRNDIGAYGGPLPL